MGTTGEERERTIHQGDIHGNFWVLLRFAGDVPGRSDAAKRIPGVDRRIREDGVHLSHDPVGKFSQS